MRNACIALIIVALCGCKTLDDLTKVATGAAVATGAIDSSSADSINRGVSAVGKTLDDITPKQEYYIGRSVAAELLGEQDLYKDAALTQYVNLVGQSLARVSDKPATYGGYHFAILDSNEINAFAAPGGTILITRGMMTCCKNEDELAAVLAHEIGHIQNADGLRAISGSRLTSALTTLATEAGKQLGGEQLAQVTAEFEGSISEVTQQLAVNGYSRRQEFQADAAAVVILQRMGYNPAALISMLENMAAKWEPHGPGFGSTHPAPADRIAKLKEQLSTTAMESEIRNARFEKHTKNL